MKKFFSCDFYRRPRVIILNCPLDFLVTLAIDLWKSLIWSHLYRVSQKFVPLISCTITFDQNFILREISRRCLFLCQVHVFRISVTGMPFLFFITFCSRCGMKWHRACSNKWSILTFFITWCAGSSSTPKQYLFSLGSWKKIYFGHSSKKDNQQGFCNSLQIWNELGVNSLSPPSQGPLILNISNSLSWPFYLAC